MIKRLRVLTAICGLLSVTVFIIAFVILGIISHDFNFFHDYISKLGSKGQPHAYYWNLFGFAMVGVLLAIFGWLFGICKKDRVLGACMMVAGIGFALGAIPTEFSNAQSPLSKAHFASVCFSLAGFCGGLARLTRPGYSDFDQASAKWVVGLALLPIICVPIGISAEPIAHRALLGIVFMWIILNSVNLIRCTLGKESDYLS